MSLIPSESSSFADLLGRGLDGSKKSKWREPVAEPPKLGGPPKPFPKLPARPEKPRVQRAREKSPKAVAVAPKAVDRKPSTPPVEKHQVPVPVPITVTRPIPKMIESPPPPQSVAPDPLALIFGFSQPPAAPIPEQVQPLSPAPVPEVMPQIIESPPVAPHPLAALFDFSPPAATPIPEQIQPVPPAPQLEVIPQMTESPPPAPDPLAVLLGLFPSSVVQVPEAVEPLQDEEMPPPEWVSEEPIRKAPLVIQPEDEPPRRPIPIVRVVRSKQNPNGNGREHSPQTNGHDLLPAPEPQTQPQTQPPIVAESVAGAAPASAPLLSIPRPRPRPPVRARVEEEPRALQPLPAVLLPEPETPQKARLAGPMAALSEPARIERAQPPTTKFDESAWLAVRIGGRNFEFRWRGRLARFLTCETLAIVVLVISVAIGMRHRTFDDPWNMITRILAIAAAVAAAIVPVLFYGLPERVPRDPR